MFSALKKLLGIRKPENFARMYSNGAHVLDVRTKREFEAGHIQGSFNIPLSELSERIAQIPRDTVIITCCASGVRSESARIVLKQMGFQQVYNGGMWMSLKNKIHS